MSFGIYVRELGTEDGHLWLASLDPVTMDGDFSKALRFRNLVEATEVVQSANLFPMRFQAVAVDPESAQEPLEICEIETLEEIPQVPLRGAVELFAMLKKSSKYYRQFEGWAKVDRVIPPSYGDHYCFRVAHNAYQHEDLLFGVKLPGVAEILRLDKWVTPARKAARKEAA